MPTKKAGGKVPTVKIALKGHALEKILPEMLPELFSASKGVEVRAMKPSGEGYSISREGKGFKVEWGCASDLMMALGDIIAGDIPAGAERRVPAFHFRGVMLDCSRNGVPTVDFLKGAVAKMALLGLNKFCLYTEDTYQVEGEPLFGFGRGAYTHSELRELDAFADKVGVEMFPCIQTLGHMEQVLKFGKYGKIADNKTVMNVLSEDTYAFVEKTIVNAAKPYKSKLIHIGTDEPWGIGRGHSLNFDKPVKPGELYARHVRRAAGICEKHSLKPIIWGDYILGHTGEAALDKSQSDAIPRSVILDYWNYYNIDTEKYSRNIDIYKDSGYEMLVSPGVWNWGRFIPHAAFAMKATEAFMAVAHKKGVKRALTTMWGDDSQECLFDSNWAALSQFACWCRQDNPPESMWMDRTLRICGSPAGSAEIFSAMQKPGLDDSVAGFTFPLSKTLFYDDPLLGYATMCSEGLDCGRILLQLSERAASAKPASKIDGKMLKLASLFAKVAGRKFELIRSARKAARAKDRKAMRKLAQEALSIAKDSKAFKALFAKLWMEERKPFGLEIVETRLAGVQSRLETFAQRASAFAKGDLEGVPELEVEKPADFHIGHMNQYVRTMSMCPVGHNL